MRVLSWIKRCLTKLIESPFVYIINKEPYKGVVLFKNTDMESLKKALAESGIPVLDIDEYEWSYELKIDKVSQPALKRLAQ